MKRGGGVHTVPWSGIRWVNKMDGGVISAHQRKEDAVAVGRKLAREHQVEHTIHRRDGVITEKNSYGSDPCPPKDGA